MIVPMKRLTLIGLANEREQVLCALQRLKAVQIISEGQLTDSAKLRLLEEKVDRLDSARKSIKAYYKKPLLSPTPQCTEDQLYKSKASGDALCREIEGLESEQSACKAEIEREKALIASLGADQKSFSISFSSSTTRIPRPPPPAAAFIITG